MGGVVPIHLFLWHYVALAADERLGQKPTVPPVDVGGLLEQ